MKKILLITGGSDGIGATTAYLATEKGYKICVNYRQNKSGAETVVNAIRSKGGEAFAVQADVSIEEEVMKLFAAIDEQEGILMALVNNAAIIEPQMKVESMTAERIDKVFSTNVTGTFLCCREAIKRMSVKKNGQGGSIVNVSSKAAAHGSPFEYIDYASSKGAIDTMTLGLSKELAEDHIRVNAVRPGIIKTAIHAKAGEPGRVDRVKEMVPMKRGGEPEEVANAILWLLSDEASYVTGALLDIAGGR